MSQSILLLSSVASGVCSCNFIVHRELNARREFYGTGNLMAIEGTGEG